MLLLNGSVEMGGASSQLRDFFVYHLLQRAKVFAGNFGYALDSNCVQSALNMFLRSKPQCPSKLEDLQRQVRM